MKKQGLIIYAVAILLLCALTVTSLAWLGLDRNSIKTQISGSLVTEYFHCGSGTENDPFVITRPIHYYHMVEFFQRLTHLPAVIYSERDSTIVKFGEEYLYFQIGCPLAQLYDPSIRPSINDDTEFYVFDYSSTGELNTKVVAGIEQGVESKTLNMAYYSGSRALMPVGSSQVPFNGQLDGKGITVSNLSITTTSNVEIISYNDAGEPVGTTSVTRKTSDVGVFGYIGPGGIPHGGNEAVASGVKNVYFENLSIDLTGVDGAAIESVDNSGVPEHFTSTTIHNNNTCYAGYLAGHITLASSMENVYVNNSTIYGGNSAQIGFGYFGCVEKADHSNITALGTTIGLLRGKGDDAGFGGSIDMRSMFTRLNRIAASVNQNTTYIPTEETVIINDETGQRVSYVTNTAQANRVNQNGANMTFRHYSSTLGGSYFFNTANGYNTYIYLTGLNRYLTKTTNIYHITTDDNKTAYIISDKDGRKFLGVSSALNVITINSDGATRWNLSDWDDDTDSGYLTSLFGQYTYYLTYTGSNLILTTDNSVATKWYHHSSGTSDELYAYIGGTPYYLVYEDGWRMTSDASTFVISDNNGHYLNVGPSGIETALSQSSATEWNYIKNQDNTITVYTMTDSGTRYLSFNNGLELSSTQFNWNYTGSNESISLYTTSNDKNYYLTYDGGWTTITLNGYYLSSNGHYMSATRDFSGVETTSTTSSLSVWQLSDPNGPSTTIALDYNGKVYYLGCDPTNGALILTENTPTTWYKNDNKYYCVINGVDNYIVYDEDYGWMTKTSNIFLIQAGDSSNYLVLMFDSNGAIVANDASINADYNTWKIDNPRGDSLIYMTIEGQNYYLCVEGSSLVARTPTEEVSDDDGNIIVHAWDANSATMWKLDNAGRYVVVDNNQSYLSFDDGAWKLTDLWYLISDGNGHYLNNEPGNTNIASDVNARWHFSNDGVIDSTSGTTRIWTIKNGTVYYLGFNGTSLTVTTTPTDWTRDSIGYYVTMNNIPYYLSYRDSVWNCYIGSYNTIYYNSSYLTINAGKTGVQSSNTLTESAKWQFQDGKLYCYINATSYYLNVSNSLVLSISGVGNTTWKKDSSNHYYVTIGDYDYYLTCDDGTWKMVIKSYYTISNGQGHYMSLNGSNNGIVDSTTLNEKSKWQFDAEGHLLCPINGTNYYVNLNGSNQLAVSTTKDTVWRRDSSSIYVSTQGDSGENEYDYYVYSIKYTANSWDVQTDHHGVLISDDNGNYLKVNNAFNGLENTNNIDEATRWVFSSYSGNTSSGNISITQNGQTRYLSHNNDTLSLNDATTNASWENDGQNLKYSNSKRSSLWGSEYVENYYLVFDNGWKLARSTQEFVFSYTTNRNTYYLSYEIRNNAPVVITTQDINKVYTWTKREGNISTIIEGVEFFLLADDNGLKLERTAINNKEWISSSSATNTGKLSYLLEDRTLLEDLYYRINFSNSNFTVTKDTAGGFLGLGVTKGNSVNITFTGSSEPLKSILTVYKPNISQVVVSNLFSSTINCSTGAVSGDSVKPTITENSIGSTVLANFPAGDISSIASAITKTGAIITQPSVVISEKEKASYNILLNETAGQTMTGPEVVTNEASGYATYFPLRLELQDENNKTSFYSDYRVSQKNTGYIVSGAHQNSGNYHSDIRVSQYSTSDIYRALNTGNNNSVTFNETYNSRLQVLTRTITSNGVVRILDSHNASATYNNGLPSNSMTVEALGLTKYELVNPGNDDVDDLSRNQLAEVLMGTRNIYGLHFMESTIDKSNTIYADQITVNGETYYNYELPEDSIDCWLVERGSINFFAGTYYSSNVTGFFSLHQIFRDSNNQIIAIKELSKVYQSPNGVKDRYIYQYTDGTYSDGYTELPSNYTMAFDLDWITNKSNQTLIQNALYYFEVPVNAGEYALGSVENRVGAYLLYLDIAANGGATVESTISGDGNELTDAFRVEFRTTPDVLADDFYSVLQFAINAPQTVSSTDFSINVSFDKDPGNVNYSKGLYSITVVNKTDVPLTLDVLLCDDDREAFNSFLYAYEVWYVNKDHSTKTRIMNLSETYFQSMASFTIPSSGVAEESSYRD